MAAAGARPVAIADGHHRYETAVRYRDERRMTRSCEPDPPFDFVLMLFLDAADDLTVLPTHRVLQGAWDAGIERLAGGLERLFAVEATTPDALVARFDAAGELAGGEGRMGLLTRDGAWLLTARREAFVDRPGEGGEAVRALDVSLLGATLETLCDIGADAVAAGQRIGYTKSATDAAFRVATGDDADAAFLLEPTPVTSIAAVAQAGDVMPQKSTYFYPKALSGLLVNPLEW